MKGNKIMNNKVENKKGTITEVITKKNGNIVTMDFSEIMKVGNDVITRKQGKTKSVYKAELFTGASDKEKKSMRVKLRRKLSAFVEEYLKAEKNPEKMKALREAWQKYSQAVYTDVKHIYDGNTSDDNINLYKRFLTAMEK